MSADREFDIWIREAILFRQNNQIDRGQWVSLERALLSERDDHSVVFISLSENKNNITKKSIRGMEPFRRRQGRGEMND